MMTKNLTILGSTGSIGRQTLDVAQALNIPVCALAALRNVELLEEQCRKFRPELAVLFDESAAEELKRRLSDMNITVASGMDGLLAAAALGSADTVVTAVSGMIGLRPTLSAIAHGKRIALANKETLVCAGELVMAEAKRCGAEVIPVDSEHSAIFQCLMGCGDRRDEQNRVEAVEHAAVRQENVAVVLDASLTLEEARGTVAELAEYVRQHAHQHEIPHGQRH